MKLMNLHLLAAKEMMPVPTQITWDPITTGMIGLLIWLLRAVGKELIDKVRSHDEILKRVVTEEDCEKAREDCDKCPDWKDFRGHYHTGNGPGSGVVIK